MNWYNKTKQAAPVVDKPELDYMDIGHCYEEEPELWIIDNRWRMHIMDEDYANHEDWYEVESHLIGDDWIASGRKTVDNQVSVNINYNLRESPSYDRRRSKIIQILDKAYNNPEIVVFDSFYG